VPTWENAQQPFTHSNYTADSVGQLVVSDMVGPLQVNSVGEARYYVLFKDVHSKYKVVYFMERKSETADCFLDYTKKSKLKRGVVCKLFAATETRCISTTTSKQPWVIYKSMYK
jgi:hypothetical protein